MYSVKRSRFLFITCWLGLQTPLVAQENLLFFSPSPHLLATDGLSQIRLVNPFFASLDNLSPSRPLPLSPSLGNKGVIETNLRSLPASSPKCPADVKVLTSRLLRDLPSYANRVMRRTRRLDRTANSFSYVVLAGNPEFEPLKLGPGEYTPTDSTADLEPPQQVFLTTLERQYIGGNAIESQHYHWLFLSQTSGGWRLAMMFSRIGSSSAERFPTPLLESSNGIVGQAVTLWLRDCRAGAIRAR